MERKWNTVSDLLYFITGITILFSVGLFFGVSPGTAKVPFHLTGEQFRL